MNFAKKAAAFAALTLTAAATGCAGKEEPAKPETGVVIDLETILTSSPWVCEEYIGDEEVENILAGFQFAPEEIAMADSQSFVFTRQMTFDTDQSVLVQYETDKIYETFWQSLDSFIDTLYENRAELTHLYGEEVMDFESASKFKEYLAWALTNGEISTREELLNLFADNICTYYFGANEYATMEGTYDIVIENNAVQVTLEDGSTEEFTYSSAGTLTGKADKSVYVQK